MRRRIVLALLVSVAVFGSLYAMAASLGGISSGNLGADTSIIASCDTNGVTAAYATAWDATDKRYEVTSVTIGGVADTCDGQTLNVSLTDSSGAQLASGTLSIPTSAATSFTVTPLSADPSAKLVEGISVLIA